MTHEHLLNVYIYVYIYNVFLNHYSNPENTQSYPHVINGEKIKLF